MFLKKIALASAAVALMGTTAMACEIGGRVSIVGNEFPAIQTVGAGAQECTGAEVTTNLTCKHTHEDKAPMKGFREAKSSFDFLVLQVRKAVVKLEFPEFPEGCKGRPFREVYQLNARVSGVWDVLN